MKNINKVIRPFLAALATALIIVPLIVITFADNSTTASLYLQPASQTIKQGATFTAQVKLATSGKVGYVKSYLDYPTGKLKVISISGSGSNFNTKLEESFDNGSGQIFIARSSNTSQSGNLLVATITFQTKNTGQAVVSFNNNSKVSETKSQPNILSSKSSGYYTVSASTAPPPSSTPPPSSPTPTPSSPTTSPTTTQPSTSTPTTTRPPTSTSNPTPNSSTNSTSEPSSNTNNTPVATVSNSSDSEIIDSEPITGDFKEKPKTWLWVMMGSGVLLASALLGGGLVMVRKHKFSNPFIHLPDADVTDLHTNILDDNTAEQSNTSDPEVNSQAIVSDNNVGIESPHPEAIPEYSPEPFVEPVATDPTDLYTTAALESQAHTAPSVSTVSSVSAPQPTSPEPLPSQQLQNTGATSTNIPETPEQLPVTDDTEPKDMFDLAEEQYHYDEKFKTPPKQ